MMSSMGDILHEKRQSDVRVPSKVGDGSEAAHRWSERINRIKESTACRVGVVLLVVVSVGLATKEYGGDLLNNLSGTFDESVFRMSETMRHDNLQNGLPGRLAEQGFERAGYTVTVLDHDGLSPAVHVRPLNEQDTKDTGKPDEVLDLLARALREWRTNPVNTDRTVMLNLKFIIGAGDVAGLNSALAGLHDKAPSTVVTSLSITGSEESEPSVAIGDFAVVLGAEAGKLVRLNLHRVTLKNLDLPLQFESLRKLDVISSHVGPSEETGNHNPANGLSELSLLESEISEPLDRVTLMSRFPALQKYTEPNRTYHVYAERVAQR